MSDDVVLQISQKRLGHPLSHYGEYEYKFSMPPRTTFHHLHSYFQVGEARDQVDIFMGVPLEGKPWTPLFLFGWPSGLGSMTYPNYTSERPFTKAVCLHLIKTIEESWWPLYERFSQLRGVK